MEEEVHDNGQAAAPQDLRRHPRYLVEGDSSLLFVDLALTQECEIMDLSLEGCRVKTKERLSGGVGYRVEAAFKVKGITFRFNGVLRWTDGGQQAGIEFVDISPRRRADLGELIGEIEAAGPKQAPAKAARESRPRPELLPPAQAAAPPPAKPVAAPPVPAAAPAAPQAAAAPQGARMERRTQARHHVDTSATIFLVRGGAPLAGRIVDLSMGGCRIRTEERFPMGIYTRVETEFRLRGLPFRLGGVIQAIHNRNMVGVRFLDLSGRKQEEVAELIKEIQQARLAVEAAGARGANP